MRVLMLTSLVTLVAFAGCIDGDGGTDIADGTPAVEAGKKTWVFDAAGNGLDPSAFPHDLPTFEQVHVTQRISGEPTIGVTRSGAVFYPSIAFDSGVPGVQPVPTSKLFRSIDGGQTWEDFSPHLMQVGTHLTSFDPYVYVDPTTGRVFNMDMGPHVACNKVSWSDDDGRSWITREGACPLPVADHPTLFSGPKVGPAGALAPVTGEVTAYPNNVYLCTNQIADTQCSLSPDGGLTWLPSQPVYLGVDGGVCSGLTGHGHASWVDGTVYLPRVSCSIKPQVAVSRDGGLSYEVVTVAEGDEYKAQAGVHEAAVSTDSDGTAYYFWLGAEGRGAFLSVSHDQGATWSAPWNVTVPGVTAMSYPSIVAGSNGRVAVQYIGTGSPLGWDLTALEDTDDPDYLEATWSAYVTVAVDADTEDPVFAATTIDDPQKPLKRGACYDRCKGDEGGMYDFLDLDIDPVTGRLWSALVDVCTQECDLPGSDATAYERAYGTVGKQVGGLLLLDEPIPAA